MNQFQYTSANVQQLRVVEPEQAQRSWRRAPSFIEFGGEALVPTNRFWRSLFHRLGISERIFRYFTHDEVFRRVTERQRDCRLRLCIAREEKKHPRLLGVSSPNRPFIAYDEALGLLNAHKGAAVTYTDGVLQSSHTPRSGDIGFKIGPDVFNNRFVMEIPVDGWCQPRIYLSLLRQICTNGAIGYARAFRSDLRIGKDAVFTLERAMGQFDHEEGFAALRQRFEQSQKSWASIAEVRALEKIISRCGGGLRVDTFEALGKLNELAGDLNALYGLANLDGLSVKRQRILPARCRVYDLINFASELATHRAKPECALRLSAYIGTLVSDEFDLEGTAERVPEFTDLFVGLN